MTKDFLEDFLPALNRVITVLQKHQIIQKREDFGLAFDTRSGTALEIATAYSKPDGGFAQPYRITATDYTRSLTLEGVRAIWPCGQTITHYYMAGEGITPALPVDYVSAAEGHGG